MNFYALIIGTEILNGRREDKHFTFIKNELAKYDHELFASFIVKDDKELLQRIFTMIQADEDAILFSFGGIGSTPDDLTREIASLIFTQKPVVTHQKFLKDIIERFADAAYPYRIHMADLPPNATLLFNPINNMSGFSLFKKYYFVPGFPSMAHPMISDVIKQNYSNSVEKFRYTLLAQTSEETLITLMQKLPTTIELSCLPLFKDAKPNVELSLSGKNNQELKQYFQMFTDELHKKDINYILK